jgi:hypothetical protein
MCATGSELPQAFFPQEVAGGKISVQSACALNTVYICISALTELLQILGALCEVRSKR